MMRTTNTTPTDRAGSVALVALIHIALGYALISSFGYRVISRPDEVIKLFNLSDQPPPSPPIVPPPPERAPSKTHKPKDPEGTAAPPALKNSPTEIKAPKSPLPTPISASPVPGQGSAPAAGAAPTPGLGTGRGGIGNGLGSGLSGTGNGGGGLGGRAVDARQVAGDIGNDDYPGDAIVDRAQGMVQFSFTVTPQGRVAGCRITRSSGSRTLDNITCRLAIRRFRFRPALDTAGHPIESQVDGEQSWSLGPTQEVTDPAPR